MIKFINHTDIRFLEEIVKNLIDPLTAEYAPEAKGYEMNSQDGTHILKLDFETIGLHKLPIIDAAINIRIKSGVFPSELYTVDNTLIQNVFGLTADSDEKLEIIMKDILRGAKVPEENIIVLVQPWAPGMYEMLTRVVLAFNLSEDQMKAIESASKVAKMGIKITTATKKVAMRAGATVNVANRVGREIVLAGTEIGASVLTSSIGTGVEMGAIVLNSAVRDLHPRELMSGTNVQQLVKTVKKSWGSKDSDKITNGFASL